MNLKLQTLSAVSLALLAASAAQAQDNVVKLGVIRYTTHSSTTGLKGPGLPPGGDAETGDATTVLAVFERMITPDIGAELVLGVPPRLKAKGTGSVAFLGDEVLSAKIVAPTVLVNYYFGQSGATFRPYLGAGINYTKFTGVRTSLPNTTISLSDTWGWAVQAGLSYAVSKEWGLFGSVARIDSKTDLVAVNSIVLTTTIDFKPVTYAAGAWFRF
jgi:outer membrane protein